MWLVTICSYVNFDDRSFGESKHWLLQMMEKVVYKLRGEEETGDPQASVYIHKP